MGKLQLSPAQTKNDKKSQSDIYLPFYPTNSKAKKLDFSNPKGAPSFKPTKKTYQISQGHMDCSFSEGQPEIHLEKIQSENQIDL